MTEIWNAREPRPVTGQRDDLGPAIHETDGDCVRIDPHDRVCADCGAYHGDPCPECGRRAFHTDDCEEGNNTVPSGARAE